MGSSTSSRSTSPVVALTTLCRSGLARSHFQRLLEPFDVAAGGGVCGGGVFLPDVVSAESVLSVRSRRGDYFGGLGTIPIRSRHLAASRRTLLGSARDRPIGDSADGCAIPGNAGYSAPDDRRWWVMGAHHGDKLRGISIAGWRIRSGRDR